MLDNPSNLTYSPTLERGPGSQFFSINFANPSLLGLRNNDAPIGTYDLEFTFDTSPGEPNTDSITVIVTEPIEILEDSVTISKAAKDRTTIFYGNPDNAAITDVILSGEVSEFFSIGEVNSGSFELLIDTKENPTPEGTYNLTFNIGSPDMGFVNFIIMATDTVEVTVAP